MTAVETELPVEATRDRVEVSGQVWLEGNEFGIIGAIDLASSPTDGGEGERLVVIDVSHKPRPDGRFGPYDIDGSGTKRTFDKQYVLVRSEMCEDGTPTTHTYEFAQGEEVELGRRRTEDHSSAAEVLGYADNTLVSRQHAVIFMDHYNELNVSDEGSMNGTQTRSARQLLGDIESDFGYTVRLDDDLREADKGHLIQPEGQGTGWGYGVYAGRPMIARDTPINGGVYPVTSKNTGEALVIDDQKYPEELDQTYDKLMSRLGRVDPEHFALGALAGIARPDKGGARRALQEVLDLVSSTLKYDLPKTNRMGQNFEKRAINDFILKGVGVCRTQAALNAYLIERMIKEGAIEGRISIDRNMNHKVKGGHAWARYTDGDGQVWIIDSAQDFVGTIDESVGRHEGWDYRRSEDLMKQLLAVKQPKPEDTMRFDS